jgi:hypothetical protein
MSHSSTHVDPDRSIQTIDEVDLPEQFAFGTTLQSNLEKLTIETFDRIFEFLCQHKSNIIESFQILSIFFHLRPHQSSLILDLIQKLLEISPFPLVWEHFANLYPVLFFKLVERGVLSLENASKYHSKSNLFGFLIFSKEFPSGEIPACFRALKEESKDLFPIEDIREFGYPKNSIGFFLKYYKFDELQQLSTFRNFNFSADTFISPCDLPPETSLNQESLLSISAFYGSVKCFKFLFMNGANVTSSVCVSAVKGGDLEIIQICEQEHGDFSKCLGASVSYLRNDVADWLLQNFEVNEFTFEECINCLNFAAFSYLHAKGGEDNHSVGTVIDSLIESISF